VEGADEGYPGHVLQRYGGVQAVMHRLDDPLDSRAVTVVPMAISRLVGCVAHMVPPRRPSTIDSYAFKPS
jgi:hypothetical protein